MKRITRIIRPIICMAVLLFAMTTAVMGCYQKEAEPIDIPGRTPSGTSAAQPSATPAGKVIPAVDRQSELAEAKKKNPDTVAWLYIPGAEVDDPVMQAEDNGNYPVALRSAHERYLVDAPLRGCLSPYGGFLCHYAGRRAETESGRFGLGTVTVHAFLIE